MTPEELNSMRTSTKYGSPSYLIQTPYGYHFRLKIPHDIKPHLDNKRELRYSLKTGSLGEAKEKSRLIAGQLQRLFRLLRQGENYMATELSDGQIQKIVKGYVKQALAESEGDRVMGKPLNPEQFDSNIFAYDWVLDDLKEALAFRDTKTVLKFVDGLLKDQNIELDKNSETYRKLCREMLKAQIKVLEIDRRREFGDYSIDRDDAQIGIQAAHEDLPEESSPSIPLSQLIEEHFNERLRAGRWSPRTIKEYKNGFRVLREFLGADTPVNRINHQDMQNYKRMLLHLPANFSKSKKWKEMTLKDVMTLKLDKKELLSVSAINRYLMNAKAVFGHGVRNGYLKTNYADGLQLPKQKRPHEQRAAFGNDDLHKIFHSKNYVEDKFQQPYMFWLPVLGLYTGARIEELCQLHCEDVYQVDGIWCIDINDNGEKRLKNEPSKRVVPLHPVLTETLNFPGYVQQLRVKGAVRVFPELKKQSHAFSHAASKWFNDRYKKQVGIKNEDGKKKVFHSFRHTLTDHLKQKLVGTSLIDELTGHALQGESMGRYGKPYLVKVLFENAVQKLEYDIDLSHLRKSRYVTG